MIDIPKNPHAGGEMLPTERAALFTWVYNAAPLTALETGTGCGFGSTFYIAEGMRQSNPEGVLYTCDPICNYQGGYSNVEHSILTSTDLIKNLISGEDIHKSELTVDFNMIPEFIFFDGPEVPEVALMDIKLLESCIQPGTLFSMHDWYLGERCHDNQVSVKSALIRPYMEEHPRWTKIEHLRGDVPEDDSVGLVLYEWKGSR